MNERNYWIGVVSKDHVALGVGGGFTQLNHGKAGPLERMRAGDGFAFYSPRTAYPDGPPLRAFTAIGRIRDGVVYQAGMGNGEGFAPFRLGVDYLPAQDAPIKPLIEDLSFIHSKPHWGAAFRFGFLRVSEADFARIATAMGRDFGADFPAAASRSAGTQTEEHRPGNST
jgi:EVE domain